MPIIGIRAGIPLPVTRRRSRPYPAGEEKEGEPLSSNEEPGRENDAPRGYDPRPGAPGACIGESPELDTLLTAALVEAHALIGARYGAIAALDRDRQAHLSVTSGITEEERARLAAWSGAPRFIEHLLEVDGPLRLADMAAYADSLGLASSSV